jgi:hypothetical protein
MVNRNIRIVMRLMGEVLEERQREQPANKHKIHLENGNIYSAFFT